MSLSCYILDDEPHAIRILQDYIAQTPDLRLTGFSTDPLQALAEISAGHPPDLVFADIDMPGLNGLEFARLASQLTTIIFTTAYREYAVEAFERRAADYLVKPLFYERFLEAVQRIRVSRRISPGPSVPPASLFVTTGIKGQQVRVGLSDILYIEGADAYINIRTVKDETRTYMTLSAVLHFLPSKDFTRVHKSYIVRDAAIVLIEPGQVKLRDGFILPIGPAYRENFRQKMRNVAQRG